MATLPQYHLLNCFLHSPPLSAVLSGNVSSPFTVYGHMYSCFNSTVGVISITIFSIIDFTLILPVCMTVLYLGFQQWRQQTPNTPMSHCDVLTYNMVFIDLLQVVGSVFSCYSIHANVSGLLSASLYMLSVYLFGQMLFYSLTCVDYYLAVVFPIVYLSLRKPKFIRARNVTIGCIWLCNIPLVVLLRSLEHDPIIGFLLSITAFLLLFIVFSCLSVLYVLIRPAPGEGGRRQVDQSKLKAFNSMIAILTVLTFRFVGTTVCNVMFVSREVKEDEKCAVLLSLFCNGLPCTLLQPILFLQRTGKLPFCKNST